MHTCIMSEGETYVAICHGPCRAVPCRAIPMARCQERKDEGQEGGGIAAKQHISTSYSTLSLHTKGQQHETSLQGTSRVQVPM